MDIICKRAVERTVLIQGLKSLHPVSYEALHQQEYRDKLLETHKDLAAAGSLFWVE